MVRMTAAQGQNGIGPTHRPEHTRPLAARTDHGLAASFDDARTDEQVLAAELGVLHTLGVLGKILDLLTNRLGQQFKWPYGLSVVLSRRSSSALPAATLGVAVALPPVFQAVGFQAAHDRLALRSPETSGNAVGDVGRNRAIEEGIETDSKVRPSTWFVG